MGLSYHIHAKPDLMMCSAATSNPIMVMKANQSDFGKAPAMGYLYEDLEEALANRDTVILVVCIPCITCETSLPQQP